MAPSALGSNWLTSAAGQLGQQHEGHDKNRSTEAHQRVTNAAVREVRADPDQEEHAREEDRYADILVRRLPGGRALGE